MYSVSPGLVLTDSQLQLGSRPLWHDVYQPVKICRADGRYHAEMNR